MIKKFLILLILIFVLLTASVIYGRLQQRTVLREQAENQKAPQVRVTFLEGWNDQQIADYLQKNNITQAQTFLAATQNFNSSSYPTLASKPQTADLEGFIFPDTYFLPQTAPSGTDISQIIIQKTLDNFTVKFTPQMQAQAAADNMSVYQIITLASIIEKETGHSLDDRKIVAGIFYNRLKAGMPLQSDATVSFFTGHAEVTDQDTQTPNPYNTFLNPGLPKGPICNPSLDSIMAALYPTQTSYLYFLTDPNTGQVYYATTYQQHLLNKQKYLK